jgi:hypothetical protein
MILNEDQCCAICRHNELSKISNYTYCANTNQTDQDLKNKTSYFNRCPLWELRDESFYEKNILNEK